MGNKDLKLKVNEGVRIEGPDITTDVIVRGTVGKGIHREVTFEIKGDNSDYVVTLTPFSELLKLAPRVRVGVYNDWNMSRNAAPVNIIAPREYSISNRLIYEPIQQTS